MYQYSKNNLETLAEVLAALPADIYSRPSKMLSQSTIGQHVRHTVEMYQCLLTGYDMALVEYDKRKRDRSIESDVNVAQKAIQNISSDLDRSDKKLQVVYDLDGSDVKLESNYDRELMYNLEHAIHHMALIKVALLEMSDIVLPPSFGVAPATIQFRAKVS